MPASSQPPSSDASRGHVTELLLRWQTGQDEALGELLPMVYRELKAPAGVTDLVFVTDARCRLSRELQRATPTIKSVCAASGHRDNQAEPT